MVFDKFSTNKLRKIARKKEFLTNTNTEYEKRLRIQKAAKIVDNFIAKTNNNKNNKKRQQKGTKKILLKVKRVWRG